MKGKWVGIFLGIFALGTNAVGHQYPHMIERYYSRGLFLGVRSMLDTLLTWIPFPSLYLFFGGIFIYWIYTIRRTIKKRKAGTFKWRNVLLNFFSGIGILLFWFYFAWGFNYSRVPIEMTMDFKVKPLTLGQIKEKMIQESQLLDSLRQKIPNVDTVAITEAFITPGIEKELRTNLTDILRVHNYPIQGRVRGKLIYPKGIFLHFSSAGLYFPFVGEGNIDAGVHPLQIPSVMTHEMAHGYGFGDEGSCNFWAYIANRDAKNPVIAYAAHLSYYRVLAVNYLRYFPREYQEFRKTLPVGIIADLNAINENGQKYPDWMPKLRYYAYDHYLKSQGIKEGMANYNRVLMLVAAYDSVQSMGAIPRD